jgi:N-acetylmuramoyl-L-alanine amidase
MKTIFLSAGHSTTDPGATAFGRTEAQIVADFRNMVAHYVAAAGTTFQTDGTGQENLPLREAVKLAAKHPIAVEFHLNAAANPKATGVETLSGPGNMALGGRICAAVSRVLDIKNRGAKPENAGQHHRLAFVQAGGIIVELFFLTNPADLLIYETKKWLVARAVAEVLIAEAGA